MSDSIDAVYVQVDDWAGLYLDDRLVEEGEMLYLPRHLNGKTVRFFVRIDNEADANYRDNVGGLPETYDGLIENQYMWEEDHRDD